ncbi:MAG TPA: Bax inhibitor-1 family protein [Candidatus Azoamicus sp.]
MNRQYNYYVKTKDHAFEDINKVAKNTYFLLSLTILFSSLMSVISIKMGFKQINIFLYIIITFGLLFLIELTKHTWYGLIMVFAFTGFLGFYLGPILKPFLSTKNGQTMISISLLITGIIFLTLSMYVYITKKDFNFLNGFIITGLIITLGLFIISFFIKTTLIQAVISGFIIMLSSSIILYETSNILHDREKNYISATISLYLQIYNLFLSIISLLNIFSSKD